MTNTDTKESAAIGASTATALQAVRAAGERVKAAKRTRSLPLIARAQDELQRTVDAARDADVEWGRIGSALGIARGNAYQKYRRRGQHAPLRYGRAGTGDARYSA